MIAFVLAAFLQATPPTAAPQLDTAYKTALQSLEAQKQKAQQDYMQAQQQEVTIEQEFNRSHAGWHINPMTLQVEKDPETAKKP